MIISSLSLFSTTNIKLSRKERKLNMSSEARGEMQTKYWQKDEEQKDFREAGGVVPPARPKVCSLVSPSPSTYTPPPSHTLFLFRSFRVTNASVSCACPPASALRTPCLDFEFIFIPLTLIFLVHNGYACTLYLWIENHLEKGERKPERKSIRPIPWRCSMQSRSKRPRRTRAGTR